MALESKIKGIIDSQLVGLKPTSSGWRKTNCPMCAHRGHRPDTKERFGVVYSPSSIGMNCFNCGFRAKWEEGSELSRDFRQFLSVVGLNQEEINALVFDAYFNKSTHEKLNSKFGNIVHHKWKPMDLPEDTKTIVEWANEENTNTDFINVVNYAMSRGIDDFNRVAWSPQKQNMMNKRLIVPFTWDGEIVGFSARMISGDKKMKYYHQTPNHFVYNLDRQNRQQKYVIVVEGVLDAFLTDGVALLHNSCSPEQASEVNSLGMKPIVCPDRDKSGDGLIDAAIQNGWSVSFPPWERGVKDAGDAVVKYGKVFTVYSIIKHATDDLDKIRLWRKLDV